MEHDNKKLISFIKNSSIGDDWIIIEDGSSLEVELQRELNKEHFLYGRYFKTIAKCEYNDDVLFYMDNSRYVIVHLTYSRNNIEGFPKYKVFNEFKEVIDYYENI